MPRGPRLDAPGTLHHVIVRGIERTQIFRTDIDREDFLTRLGQVVEEGGAACFAWVLIPNHAHVLLRTGATQLAKMMRRLLTGYAVNFNLRYQRSGHLFQNRYKSIVCEEDSYLLELIRYIHLNSIRAGLVKGMKELDRYLWSGHSVLMGYQNRQWQSREEVLSYFGEGQRLAQRKYRRFVFEGIRLGRREELTGGTKRQPDEERNGESRMRFDYRILGSGRFVEDLLAEEQRMVKERALVKKNGIHLGGLMDFICTNFGVTKEEILGGSQRPVVGRARSVLCHIGSRDLGLTGRELSQTLGLTPAAIHYAIERGGKLLNQNTQVEEGVKKYLKDLTTSPESVP